MNPNKRKKNVVRKTKKKSIYGTMYGGKLAGIIYVGMFAIWILALLAVAWVGACDEETNDKEYCEEHLKEICVSCGKKASRACSETMGLVCGTPLCDECEHTIRENGCNSGAPLPEGLSGHCKKTKQVFKPWYARKEPFGETKEKK